MREPPGLWRALELQVELELEWGAMSLYHCDDLPFKLTEADKPSSYSGLADALGWEDIWTKSVAKPRAAAIRQPISAPGSGKESGNATGNASGKPSNRTSDDTNGEDTGTAVGRGTTATTATPATSGTVVGKGTTATTATESTTAATATPATSG